MVKRFCLAMTLCLSILLQSNLVYASGIAKANQSVKISTGSKEVKAIVTDLTNPNIELFPVIAQNKIGGSGSLSDIVAPYKDANTQNIAAINGDFFAAYDGTNLPYGMAKKNGDLFHNDGVNIAMVFDQNYNSDVDLVTLSVEFKTIRTDGYEFTWNAWGINHIFEYDGEIVVYTPYYGTEVSRNNGNMVVVQNGKIAEKTRGAAKIYPDGYTIYIHDNSQLFDRLSVGDTLSYDFGYSGKYGGSLSHWDNYNTLISGGPILIRNKTVHSDFAAQGFTEAKILTAKAQRSFMGITADKKLITATVANVTMNELAEIAQAMGAINAIALDGGASSGLFFNDEMITTPGRKLTNVIIIRENNGSPAKPTPQAIQVSLSVNGHFVPLNNTVYVLEQRNYTPVRDIAEALGGSITWIPGTDYITISKGSIQMILTNNSDEYILNGTKMCMEVPTFVDSKTDRMYVSARYLAEALGYRVNWNGLSQTIEISN